MSWRHRHNSSRGSAPQGQVVHHIQNLDHGSHPRRGLQSRPGHWLHTAICQCAIPPSGGGNGTSHVTHRPGHDTAHQGVAERYNAPLPPHFLKKFHGRPRRPHVPIRRLHDHPVSARCRLAPRGAARLPHALLAGVSEGLVQDRCGLIDLKISFLHQLLVL